MRTIRILGSVALWLGALLGVAAGGVWIGGQLGLIKPMIVISGSMEPGIMTGDLLVDRWASTETVEVGDVLSLPSEFTGKLVTHRVISIAPVDADRAAIVGVDLSDGPRWEVRMQGDANDEADLEAYFPGHRVLTPAAQIPGAGKVVSKLMEPAVAMPVLLALIALLGLSLLDEEPRKVMRRVIDRVRQRDPRVDELDLELAAVGVDVLRLQEMDDLDLQLYALGIEIGATDTEFSATEFTDTIIATEFTDAVSTSAPENGAAAAPREADVALNDRGVEDGLWNFQLPEFDGIRSPSTSDAQHTEANGDRPTERTPVRSG